MLVMFDERPIEKKYILLLFIASLAAVNRLDNVIIYIPVLVFIFISRFKQTGIMKSIIGTLPITAWLGFSFIYYGFFLPNTYYAKVNSSFSEEVYFNRGIAYVIDIFRNDTM